MKLLKPFIAAALAAMLSAGAYAEDINFGIISTDSTSVLKQRWEPLIADMEKSTGLTVHAFFATDYSGVIEGMRFNKVQLAWYGNKSAIEAVDRANGEVFAKVVYADGSEGYKSLLITNVNSPYKTLDDVLKNGKNINFGIGDPESTSGTLVPSYYIFAKNNIDPKSYFKTIRSSNHESNLLATINNQVDVATNNTEMLDKLKTDHPDKAAQVRVLWTSPLIPSDPLVWRRDLPDATKAKLRNFFLTYGDTQHGRDILFAIYKWGGFRASSDAQLVPVRQLSLFQDKLKVQGDAHLDPALKQQQVAKLDAQLAALQQAGAGN
jgi:phosphonate transport system substrate-binding protein